MKIRLSILLALSSLIMVFILCANTLCAQELVSADPRYAAVVLPEFGGKNVSVIFDESAGTGKGYDTVYVDANLDGTITGDERFIDKSISKLANRKYHFIDPVAINPSEKKQVSCEISFSLLNLEKNVLFDIYVTRKMPYNGKQWTIKYTSGIEPSKSAANPFIFNPVNEPKAVVKSSESRKVVGIAISLASGTIDITSSDITVDLVLKNSAGRIVKKAQNSLDKFGFG